MNGGCLHIESIPKSWRSGPQNDFEMTGEGISPENPQNPSAEISADRLGSVAAKVGRLGALTSSQRSSVRMDSDWEMRRSDQPTLLI